jgi:hypothetical protein
VADREALGRLVRETWVAWAREQSDPKPSWLTGWDDLDGGQREVDMRIGEAIEAMVRAEDTPKPLPLAGQIRAWLVAQDWRPASRGTAGTLWYPPGGDPVGVPDDDSDPLLTAGALERIAKRSHLTVGYLTEMLRSDG